MKYYEVILLIVNRLSGRPKNKHRNFYNVKDPSDLAKRLKNYLEREVPDDSEVLSITVHEVEN